MTEFLTNMNEFASWLCSHEFDIVGLPGTCFHCPLAQWLSEQAGGVWGVDDHFYGTASRAHWQWRTLPRWAALFVSRIERRAFRPVTGDEALLALAEVELALTSFQREISDSPDISQGQAPVFSSSRL
ncbi:MAG TPA: hypothetical protein VFA10_30205 [Ktedonobacteraceae bacterium]|nr:hypothetical protein [Ktedonobacteraceae bacterium]